MTNQTTIPVPATGPARPVVIPPGAVRCWVLDASNDDSGYIDEVHFPTEIDAHQRSLRLTDPFKAIQLPYVCVVAACNTCRVQLVGEYPGTLHLPNWAEAERVAKCDGWTIGDRGEFHCPECQEKR